MESNLSRMAVKNTRMAATLLGAMAFLGPAGAGVLSITGGSTSPPNTWETESGQSIPTGVAGFVGGTLVAGIAGQYTFTYGGNGLMAGDSGHGDSVYINEFWVGTSEAAAEAAGNVFCTHPGDASCGGVATPVNSQFTLTLGAGAIPFGFTFGATNQNVLTNGSSNNALGAYLAQIGLGLTPNAGPGLVAYLGLSDNGYPSDRDFQDMVVTVSTTPEPASLLLLGAGLSGLALLGRRRTRRTS